MIYLQICRSQLTKTICIHFNFNPDPCFPQCTVNFLPHLSINPYYLWASQSTIQHRSVPSPSARSTFSLILALLPYCRMGSLIDYSSTDPRIAPVRGLTLCLPISETLVNPSLIHLIFSQPNFTSVICDWIFWTKYFYECTWSSSNLNISYKLVPLNPLHSARIKLLQCHLIPILLLIVLSNSDMTISLNVGLPKHHRISCYRRGITEPVAVIPLL